VSEELKGQIDDSTSAVLLHLSYVRKDIADLKKGVDQINGRVRTNEGKLLVMEDRHKRVGRKGAAWGAGVGAAISGGLITFWQFLGGNGP
jgi:hypothetical protein